MQETFKEVQKTKLNTKEIINLLKKAYKLPEYALFTEVGNGTGTKQFRRADAIAVALWESLGMKIIGFEIKTCRSDVLKELKNPEKANEMMKYCNEWFIVASKDIISIDEIPEEWGWIDTSSRIDTSGRLREVKKPQRKEAELSVGFVACLLRRAAQDLKKIELFQEILDTNGNMRVLHIM